MTEKKGIWSWIFCDLFGVEQQNERPPEIYLIPQARYQHELHRILDSFKKGTIDRDEAEMQIQIITNGMIGYLRKLRIDT